MTIISLIPNLDGLKLSRRNYMKKKRLLFLLGIAFPSLIGTTLFVNANKEAFKTSKAAAVGEEVSYSEFTEVPTGWTLDPYSDDEHSTVSVDPDTKELLLENSVGSGANQGTYWGGLLKIAPEKTYEDFTFEMEFRFVSYASTSRYFTLGYHVNFQEGSNRPIGYATNYRPQGDSADVLMYVTSGSTNTQDSNKKTSLSQKPTIESGYNTYKVSMMGSIATTYMNNVYIGSYDTNNCQGPDGDYNTLLGVESYFQTGIFTLCVNQAKIAVKSINISPNPQKLEVAPIYSYDDDAVGTEGSTILYNYDGQPHSPYVSAFSLRGNTNILFNDVPFTHNYTRYEVGAGKNAPSRIGQYGYSVTITENDKYNSLDSSLTGTNYRWKVFRIKDTKDTFLDSWRALREAGGSRGLCYYLENGSEKMAELTSIIERYDDKYFVRDIKDQVKDEIDIDEYTIDQSIEYFRSALSVTTKTLTNRLNFVKITENNLVLPVLFISGVVITIALAGYFLTKKRAK